MKTIDDMIAVMQAAKEGKAIQVKSRKCSDDWGDAGCPSWNWECWDYRVKPTYREPTGDDAGRMVEVRNFLDQPWEKPRELIGVLMTDGGKPAFATREGRVGYLYQWRFARIED